MKEKSVPSGCRPLNGMCHDFAIEILTASAYSDDVRRTGNLGCKQRNFFGRTEKTKRRNENDASNVVRSWKATGAVPQWALYCLEVRRSTAVISWLSSHGLAVTRRHPQLHERMTTVACLPDTSAEPPASVQPAVSVSPDTQLVSSHSFLGDLPTVSLPPVCLPVDDGPALASPIATGSTSSPCVHEVPPLPQLDEADIAEFIGLPLTASSPDAALSDDSESGDSSDDAGGITTHRRTF
jgi:hypothetical protein